MVNKYLSGCGYGHHMCDFFFIHRFELDRGNDYLHSDFAILMYIRGTCGAFKPSTLRLIKQ